MRRWREDDGAALMGWSGGGSMVSGRVVGTVGVSEYDEVHASGSWEQER